MVVQLVNYCVIKNVESVDLVEIDERVVDISRKYLPQTACSFDDERLHCYFEDGLKFIRHCNNEYDLIIVDSTDPFGPGEGLFTKEFYGNCYKALKEDGIMVNQHEKSIFMMKMLLLCNAHINAL
mgnify:CR=1 FL=1